MPLNCVYVGRPTIWGNPFSSDFAGLRRHEQGKVRGALAERYRNYLPGLLKAQPYISLEQLRGKDLACWCPLDQPCHADVLLEIANEVAQ